MTGPYRPHALDQRGRPIRPLWLAASRRAPTCEELACDSYNGPANDNGKGPT